jgi:membrane fusion protein, heavy metal efflux system
MTNQTRRLILVVLLLTSPVAMAQDPHDHDAKQASTKAQDPHNDHADPHADPDADPHDSHVDEVKLSEAAVRLSGIRVEAASKRSLTASFVTSARVAFNAEAMAHVGSVVSGRVVDIKARQGDAVQKGDVLLVVESPELGRSESEFLQRLTEAEVAAAAVDPAKDAYERARKLFDESQGIALSEVQKREVEYRAAVGARATSQSQVEAAENELHLLGFTQDEVQKLAESKEIKPQFTIRAPIDGQVVEREVTLGELVAPGKERLLVLADTSNFWVLADVPEGRLGQVGVGSSAEIQVASMQAERIAERIKGQVSLIGSEVDPTTRAARVRIVIKNTDNKLKPGMFARVVLSDANAADAVVAIPTEAVQTVEGSTAVFVPVEGEPNTFAKRAVVVGRPINGYVPVVSGLVDGESFVVSGTFILKAELGKGSAEHVH